MPAVMDEGEGGAPTTPSGQTPGGSGPVLSKRKVVDKIQVIKQWRCIYAYPVDYGLLDTPS